MEKLRTVRGVHDLLPYELHKHNIVVNAGLEISDNHIAHDEIGNYNLRYPCSSDYDFFWRLIIPMKLF